MGDFSFPGLLSSVTDSGSNSGASGPFGLPPGLLTPDLASYAKRQAMMGLAQGLLKAGAPSYMPKSFGSIAADAGGGFLSGEQSGIDNALKLQQVMMQRGGIMATYNALAPKVGPQAALVYAMNPSLLAGQMKPIAEPAGGNIIQPLSLDAGGGGGGANAPASFAQGPGGVPAPAQAPGAAPAQGGAAPAQVSGAAAAPAQATDTVTAPPGGKVIASNTNGLLGPDALGQLVQRGLTGEDVEKAGGFGMGTLGQTNKTRYQTALAAAMKAQGISPEELTGRRARFPAYQKGIGDLTDMQVRMGTARNEFQNLWPQFVAQVQKVNGGALGNFPKFNQVRQYIQEHKGDPEVVQLDNYLTGLENQYVRAVSTSRSGPTVNDHQNFEGMINKFWNPAQIQSTGVALTNEMDAARQSIPQMRDELTQEFGLAPKSAPRAAATKMPSIPAALAGVKGLQFSPSRGLFRDAQGKFYKADGTAAQ